MKRMTNIAVLVAAVAVFVTVGVAYAVPLVTDVEMTQREGSRIVDITYELDGEAAIVTLGIETNGVAIPDSAVTRLSGDVCKKVEMGSRFITWNAGADWPEHAVTNACARVTAWSTNAPPQVMVIDLSKGTAASEESPYLVLYYTSLDALPGGGLSNAIYKTDKLVMNKIFSGDYAMGVESTAGASVTVTLTKNFYAGVYQVTQKQWYKVMGTDPSALKNSANPVDRVSYYDIREKWTAGFDWEGGSAIATNWPQSKKVGEVSFVGRLQTKTGLSGFDLPTEAQWEYACRAGTTTYYNNGSDGSSTNQLNDLGWWKGNSGESTHPVGLKTPNMWGLYDMHGNVCEWCLDWYQVALEGGPDPDGADLGLTRVFRGGSKIHPAPECRSAADRLFYAPSYRAHYLGFRLVRNLR